MNNKFERSLNFNKKVMLITNEIEEDEIDTSEDEDLESDDSDIDDEDEETDEE